MYSVTVMYKIELFAYMALIGHITLLLQKILHDLFPTSAYINYFKALRKEMHASVCGWYCAMLALLYADC